MNSQMIAKFEINHLDKNDRMEINRKKMYLFGKGDSNMYYDAYCNGASLLRYGFALISVLYTSYF